MTKRKMLGVVLGVALLGVFLFAIWPFVVGGSHMEAFCGTLAKGTPISGIRDLAQQKGYRMTSSNKEGRAFIHDSRSFGRFLCEVEFKEERMMSARYQLSD